MNCYNCGGVLSEKDFCTRCGVDVTRYKQTVYLSNFYYNAGLEQANVRNLSGAIISLRQSLKFNKNNVDARNLLGLIYFEMGEVVLALSEWVISKNIRAKKNLANDYLEKVQKDKSKFELRAQAIRKYNQALLYCNQSSEDLAIIQLKKVLNSFGKYVKAHLLLALLYIHAEEWDKAKREVQKVLEIDLNNTMALRYKKEIEYITTLPEDRELAKKRKKNKQGEDVVKYQIGTETIIRPMTESERGPSPIILAFAAGICIGVALIFFLVMPAQVTNAKQEANEEVIAIGEELAMKTSDIASLKQQVESLQSENNRLEGELGNYVGTDGKLRANDQLLIAANEYILDDTNYSVIADYIDQVDQTFLEEEASEAFIVLYDALMEYVGEEASAEYYLEGYHAYEDEDYETAILYLTKAYKFNDDNADALFNLGNAYDKNGNTEQAVEVFREVVEKFPEYRVATKAQDYINQFE